MAWSNEDTFKFLDMYQNEPDIWDPKSKNYKDRIKVNDAWNRLSEAMGMSIDKLKRRKETLMTAFRFHFKKKQEAFRLGSEYTPIWTFYKPMQSFLDDVYGSKNWTNTEDNESTSSRQDDIESEDDLDEDLMERKRNKFKKRRFNQGHDNSDMKNAFKSFNSVLKKYNELNAQEEDEDECDLYGRLVAKKLRQFSETERHEIMYEFDGVLLNRRHNYDPGTPYNLFPLHSPPEVIIGKQEQSGSSTPSHSPT
ncbi:uncharacterized protein [Epargyreus clarus]|uniref:uncharacterized protein n=1 Tax=Epargyreus clarus TaxID=520877 RepID=UPI003C2D968A